MARRGRGRGLSPLYLPLRPHLSRLPKLRRACPSSPLHLFASHPSPSSSTSSTSSSLGDGITPPGSLMCHPLHTVRTIMDPGAPQRGSHTLMLRPHTRSRMVDPRRSTDGIHPLRLRLHSSSSSSILPRRLLASLFTRASCTNVNKVPVNNHSTCSRVKTLMFHPVVASRSRSRLRPRVLPLHPFLP